MLPPAGPPVNLPRSPKLLLLDLGRSLFLCITVEYKFSAEFPVSSSGGASQWGVSHTTYATTQTLGRGDERLTIFSKSDFYFRFPLFHDRLTEKEKEEDVVSLPQNFTENTTSVSPLTSRPARASCISRTPALAAPSGWGRCSLVAQSCCWPGRWSEAAGWRRRRRSHTSPDWGRSKPPGCTAASCSRHCTESHWEQTNAQLENKGEVEWDEKYW